MLWREGASIALHNWSEIRSAGFLLLHPVSGHLEYRTTLRRLATVVGRRDTSDLRRRRFFRRSTLRPPQSFSQ